MGWADGRENFDSVSPFLWICQYLPCLIREKHRTTHGKPTENPWETIQPDQPDCQTSHGTARGLFCVVEGSRGGRWDRDAEELKRNWRFFFSLRSDIRDISTYRFIDKLW